MTAVPSLGRPRTKAETAEFFGVKPRTIEKWVAAGLLARMKQGRVVRFTDEHLAAFIDRRSSGDSAAAPKPRRNPAKYPPIAA